MGKENMQNRKPMILVLAGPNGSGKSTITAFFDKVGNIDFFRAPARKIMHRHLRNAIRMSVMAGAILPRTVCQK